MQRIGSLFRCSLGGLVKRSWVGGALLLALAACGSDDDIREATLGEAPRFPVPGCEHLDHTPCDTLVTECQNRLLELAACVRGDDPGTLPAITVIDQEQYANRLTLLGRAQLLGARSIVEPI